jgi:hypothetical protein
MTLSLRDHAGRLQGSIGRGRIISPGHERAMNRATVHLSLSKPSSASRPPRRSQRGSRRRRTRERCASATSPPRSRLAIVSCSVSPIRSIAGAENHALERHQAWPQAHPHASPAAGGETSREGAQGGRRRNRGSYNVSRWSIQRLQVRRSGRRWRGSHLVAFGWFESTLHKNWLKF